MSSSNGCRVACLGLYMFVGSMVLTARTGAQLAAIELPKHPLGVLRSSFALSWVVRYVREWQLGCVC